jgi:ActD protein
MKVKGAIIGIYDKESHMLKVLEHCRDENIKVDDVFTPYPVSEVFAILKLKTRLPIAAFAFALLGFSFAYWYLYYTAVISYPLIFGGKPVHAIPSFFLISFVSMISLSVLLSFLSFLIRSRLYPGKRPTLIDPRSTNDAFIIVINKPLKMTDDEEQLIRSILTQHGALDVKVKEISV